MKYQKRLLVALCFTLILMKSWSIEVVTATINSKDLNSNEYIISTPIVIQSDSNISLYSLPGNGTEEDPYRIENLNITTTEEASISISYTTKYFLIQNCLLDGDSYSIYILDVAPDSIKIRNNLCQNYQKSGMEIRKAEGIELFNNTCNKGNDWGIHATFSPNINISNNTCTQSNEGGIFLNYCNYSYIYGNNISENHKGGILLDDSFFAAIISNSLSDNSYQGGIRLSKSHSATIANNSCFNNVQFNIHLVFSNDSIVTNNHCFGRGTGLSVVYGGNVSVINNKISTESYGIYVRDSEYSEFTGNNLTECDYYFYELNPADYHTYTVENNLINGKQFGYFTNQHDLKLSEPIYGQILLSNCSGFIIKNQILERTGIGLLAKFSDRITIIHNKCSFNIERGIQLVQTSNSIIENNSLSFNILGLELENSSNNTITYNTLTSNIVWGVFLDEDSVNNLVHHNSFYDNNQYYGTSQARDDGDNIWYDEVLEEGNYWSDYLVVGSYYIDGDAGTQDLYPLAEPPIYEPPDSKNNNIYYSLLSFIVLIPLTVFGYLRFSSKRKR